jgi:hypothetical protein
MADSNKYCCFKGRGNIGLAVRSAFLAKTAGIAKVGNSSVFDINVTESVEEVKDYTTAAGGTDCTSRMIDKVEFDLSMLCHTPENIARSLLGSGSSDNIVSAVVASEPHVAWPGTIVPLENLPDRSVEILVKSSDDVTTYDEGTDYIITPAGSIEIIDGSTIPAPTVTAGVGQPNIKVSYTGLKHSLIQLLTGSGVEYVLHFDGVNAITGNPAQFSLYRVYLSPAKKISGISDTAGKIDVVGTVLRDSGKSVGTTANPLSQYGTIKLAA